MTKIYSNKIWEKVKIKAEINEVENIKLCLKILVLCSKKKKTNIIRKCPYSEKCTKNKQCTKKKFSVSNEW